MRFLMVVIITFIIIIISVSPKIALSFEPALVKTEVGITVRFSHWTHSPQALIEWEDCRYYHTNLNTTFDFELTLLFCSSIQFQYKGLSLGYEYLSNDLPGDIHISEYEGKLQKKTALLFIPSKAQFHHNKFKWLMTYTII